MDEPGETRRSPVIGTPLGAFSPFASLGADSPGSRVLLAEVERAAERALHVVRGASLAVIVFFLLVMGRHVPVGVIVLSAIGLPVAAFLWRVVWRRLGESSPPRWLPYVLILVDAWVTLRGPLAVRTPLYRALHMEQYLTPADFVTLAGPLLTLLGISGTFRLNPRMALFSTAVAVSSWAVIAVTLQVSHNIALGTGALIAFAGLLGMQGARVLRYAMLKMGEEAVLERYVPEALVEELVRSGDPLAAGREAEITVVIVDIRGYTARAERLTPQAAVAFLNDYFSVVVAPLAAERAVLDKYIGDGVFAFLEGPEHERRAMRAARGILRAIERYNEGRPPDDPIRIGIALHRGKALVGTIGVESKREYTAIADTVNIAARLEELNKQFHSTLVVSEAVVEALDPDSRADLLGPVLTQIRGRNAPVSVRYLPDLPT